MAVLSLGISIPLGGVALAAPSDVTVPLTPAPLFGASAEPAADAPDGTDVAVGYGGALTVRFPALATPGPGTVFGLWFNDPFPSNWNSSFTSDGSSGGVLAVTSLGDHAYRIDIPTAAAVGGSAAQHSARLQVDGLTTTLSRGSDSWPGAGFNAPLAVTDGGPSTAALSSHLRVNGYLPTVAVGTGGTVRLTLPTSSGLYQAGLTSLRAAGISLQRANAGNLTEDWGPALPVTTVVTSDGLGASVHIPGNLPEARYALQVKLAQPHLFVTASFLVDLTTPDPVPAPVVPPTTAPAATSTSATTAAPAPGTLAAAATPAPRLQDRSDSAPSWVLWTTVGLVVLAAAGGAGFLARRRATNR